MPLKRQLFTALRSVYRPPESIYKHLHFEGAFPVTYRGRSFNIYHTGTWIENSLFWEGVGAMWEPASLNLWAQLCERAQVILDIGANTGIYATIAAAMNPKARILAFEPNPEFARGITGSTKTNGSAIQLYVTALSDMQGELQYDGYQVVVRPSKDSGGDTTAVPATTLKYVIEEAPLGRVDLIKMDVEHHEPQVLRGMGEYLKKFQPDMLIEVHGEQAAKELRPLLKGLDYRYFSIDDDRGTVREIPEVQDSDFWNILACRPDHVKDLSFDLP